MQQPLTLGIAGLGTVGAGLLAAARRITRTRLGGACRPADRSRRRLGAHARARSAASSIGGITWFDDPVQLATDPVDRRVRRADRRLGRRRQGRRRGGAAAPASTSSPPTRRCSPSTASRLRKLAEKNGVALNFEAAVAGGIPVIKTLREVARRQRGAARLRHPQRHLQLHPDARWQTSSAPSATC